MEKFFLRKSRMLLVTLIGLALVTGCNFPNIKEPVYSCHISFERGLFNCGQRILNIKDERVGDWLNPDENTQGAIEEIPEKELVCYSLEAHLTKIKPTLKEGHAFWIDYTERNK